VNGEEHQYWDFDTTRWGSGNIILDEGDVNPVHTNEEWFAVSENLANTDPSENHWTDEINAIYNIQNSSYAQSVPALVCYFVGRGGEHLAFTNYAQTVYSPSSGGSGVGFANAVVCADGANKFMPSGFGVVLSPYNDFTGAITRSVTDNVYPNDCLSPIGPKTARNTSSNSGFNTIIKDSSNGDSFTFGFAVKGPKVIVIVTSPKFETTNSKGKRYMFLVFGDIYTQCQEGDTKTYGAVCGYDSDTSEPGTYNTSFSGFTATNAVALSSTGERMCKFFTSSSDSVYYTYRELQKGFPIGHSSDLSDGIPYTTLVVSFYQSTEGNTQTDPLIKDGNGYKGIVDPEVMRFVPATVPVGTLGGGKFIVPRQISTAASTNYCFGWDPSNPSAI
jgi:hypothetical protein